jgi:hypothetical protein
MIYRQLENRDDLIAYWNDLQRAARGMSERVSVNGYSTEFMLKLMITHVDDEDCFLTVVLTEDLKFVGFFFALHIPQTDRPWTEVIAIWSEPGVGSKIKLDFNKLFEDWCRMRGSKKIITFVRRRLKHDEDIPGVTFYKIWHKPIGYKIAGVMLEKEL